jgi:hypothetical protein
MSTGKVLLIVGAVMTAFAVIIGVAGLLALRLLK